MFKTNGRNKRGKKDTSNFIKSSFVCPKCNKEYSFKAEFGETYYCKECEKNKSTAKLIKTITKPLGV